MAKCHDLIHGIEYHWVLKHPVVVELAKVLDFSNPPLVELEVILLKAERDGLNYMVNDANDKLGMISVEGTQENGKEVDVAIFDLPGLRKDFVQNRDNLMMISRECE